MRLAPSSRLYKFIEQYIAEDIRIMQTLKKNLLFVILIYCSCLLCGCAAVIIGAGVGAGAFAYAKGKLTRMYATEYHETVRASIETLDSLKISIKEMTADELKTNIFAERPDGTPVNIEIIRVSPNKTEVGIRTGNVGVFNQKISYQIHDFILKRLESKAVAISKPTDSLAPKVQDAENEMRKPASEDETSPVLKPRWPNNLTIYFDKDSNELSPEGINKLDNIAEILQERPNDKTVLNGYTDSIGKNDYNKMIAESRASAVKIYLVGKGIAPMRIEIIGHGAKNFAASNATEKGRRLNRRVEIYIIHSIKDFGSTYIIEINRKSI
jgi:outer membrane protein OmpA-like peptidoglycan-associated protein